MGVEPRVGLPDQRAVEPLLAAPGLIACREQDAGPPAGGRSGDGADDGVNIGIGAIRRSSAGESSLHSAWMAYNADA